MKNHLLINDSNIPKKLKEFEKFDSNSAYKKFSYTQFNKTKTITIKILKYAAVIIPVLLASYFMFNTNKAQSDGIEIVDAKIHPGTSKAILKLADGTTINLEDETKEIKETDGTVISTDQKKVVYSADAKKVSPRRVKYNTIEIPRGGEYQLTLSDGTKVWLNSETVIKYPVLFSKDVREIFIEGEAYFEVARDEKIPFVVQTSKIKVNVLGTSFNVRVYSNENMVSTTLVHGEVSLQKNNDDKEYILKPNEQAIISENESIIRYVDVTQYIAWKNGRIYYEDNTLEEIFNDLIRWYDIYIVYESEELKSLRFSIDMKRYDKFSDILEIINLTKKVKFKINGNNITVIKG